MTVNQILREARERIADLPPRTFEEAFDELNRLLGDVDRAMPITDRCWDVILAHRAKNPKDSDRILNITVGLESAYQLAIAASCMGAGFNSLKLSVKAL